MLKIGIGSFNHQFCTTKAESKYHFTKAFRRFPKLAYFVLEKELLNFRKRHPGRLTWNQETQISLVENKPFQNLFFAPATSSRPQYIHSPHYGELG